MTLIYHYRLKIKVKIQEQEKMNKMQQIMIIIDNLSHGI